jgi:raffinose/stachyose/melibiose transport system substrate-binding protein
MNRFSFFYGIAAALMFACAFGCKAPDKGYDLYIYIPADQDTIHFKAACAAYTAERGIRIRAVSASPGQDYIQALRAELNSKNKPVLFSVRGIYDLETLRAHGLTQDLSHAESSAFAELVSGISPELRLTLEGKTSYGIPATINGYGYIVNRGMLAALFGAGNEDAVFADIKTATYDEWTALVRAIDRWIRFPFATRVVLSGRIYTLVSVKTETAANLNGVFAVMGLEKRTYGDRLINAALDMAFSSTGDAYIAVGSIAFNSNNIDNAAAEDTAGLIRPALIDSVRMLDFETQYLAGEDGPVKRDEGFAVSANNEQVLRIFIEGKAVFLEQGTWAYGDIAEINAAAASQLEFLPVKMPFTNVNAGEGGGRTAEKYNRSIPVFVSAYYAVSALAAITEKKLACDFLVWLNTTGRKYLADDPDFIPHNAAAEASGSLGNSLLSYIKTDTIIVASSGTVFVFSSGDLSRKLMEEYLIKPVWTEEDYEAIADYAANVWLSRADGSDNHYIAEP